MVLSFLKEVFRAPLRWFARARVRQGDRLMAQGDLAAAIRRYRQAVASAPWMGEARNNLGVALMAAGEGEAAEREFLCASEALPPCIEAHLNLAQRHLDTARPGAAAQRLREIAAQAAGNPRLLMLQGYCALEFGDAEAAVRHYREAWRRDPLDADAAGGFLMSLAYAESVTPAALCAAHREWAAHRQARPAQPVPDATGMHRVSPAPPWRIGYLSPDFRDHALRFFFEPLIRHHDRARFHVYCYSDARKADQYTQNFRRRADGWRDTCGLPDAELAAMIRRDRIDVLVDLAGHTSGNRLALMAERQAPLQITGLGYPPTTGLSTIDYKLTDAQADPPGADAHYAERLLRLPGTFWCYAPPQEAPDVAPPPFASKGFVTFGCLGNLVKVGDGVLKAWAEVLAGMPGAHLLLKCPSLGDDAVREFTRERMRAAGMDIARVEFEGRGDLGGFLSAYSRVDVVLDTFPYNGGTTTCHALWMGVPVVSLAGEILVSRMGASMLRNVGLEDLVARSWPQYVETTIRLARDGSRLAALRGSLREQTRTSPLADAPRFVATLEAAFAGLLRDAGRRVAPPQISG